MPGHAQPLPSYRIFSPFPHNVVPFASNLSELSQSFSHAMKPSLLIKSILHKVTQPRLFYHSSSK